jgi:para-aminobenzoate synthetase
VEPLARTEDGLLIAARRTDRPQWGVQFHPESIATEYGDRLMANFRSLAMAARGHPNGDGRQSRAAMPERPLIRATSKPVYELHVRELAQPPDPETAFVTLFGADPTAYWLDSSRVMQGYARFSMLGGSGPLAERVVYSVRQRLVTVLDRNGTEIARHEEDLFTYLDGRLAERQLPDAGLPSDFNLG